MANPFKANDRVICTAGIDAGVTGTVYSVRDETVMVTLDNSTGAMQWHHTHFEMEKDNSKALTVLNGFVVIARRELRNDDFDCILAVRQTNSSGYNYEYVTAWHRRGEREWSAGHYFSNSPELAMEDYLTR